MVDKQKIAVYYNSACPVCKAGIESQKGKMEGCAIDWKDVHSDSTLVNDINSELEFVRERLHIVNTEGNILVGFDAFLEIWRNSPREHWKADFFGLPILRQTATHSYNLFAAALYKWNRAKKHW
jgi:predicted DCC family thiol-disulfide oxidoreductase YuxK